MTFSKFDYEMMGEALLEAEKAFQAGEVPVGAVVIGGGKIIARAHNHTENLNDPTAHAELLAIREAARAAGGWRLLDMTLYSTLEPCAMCAGALILARLKEVVWGAPDLRHGAGGSWVDLFEAEHPIHRAQARSGLREEEGAKLMKDFFKLQRERNGARKPV